MQKEVEAIISVENVSKVFKLPHEKLSTVKQHFVNIFNSKSYEKFMALDDVSFEIKKGEFFGLIGANGSGKSTMLKILAGIYQPTSGKVTINGSLSPFIELGVGFNPELTARENIFLNAAILGMSKKETEGKFDEIVKFSELENFLDQKLKNFSSGMQVRLAFSIAIQANADILLVDEVLAVGDAAFQEKCLDVFKRLKKQGKTIVFVSHALGTVEEFCDRVLFLKSGKVQIFGEASKTILSYLRTTNEEQVKIESKLKNHTTKTSVEIKDIRLLNQNQVESKVFETGSLIRVRISFASKSKIENPVFGIAINTNDGLLITGPNTKTSNYQIDKIDEEGYIDYIIEKVPFLSGRYYITVGIFNHNLSFVYDFIDKGSSFRVIPNKLNQNGFILLNEAWEKKSK